MCYFQCLKHTLGFWFRKIVHCVQIFWNILWVPRAPHVIDVQIKMSSELDEETMVLRHRREVKELQVRASAMKKGAPVSDKKRRKEVLAEIEQLEIELQNRHKAELESLAENATEEIKPEAAEVTQTNHAPPLSNGYHDSSSTEATESAPVNVVPESTVGDDDNEEEKVDGAGQKLTRAQRRRVNKQAKLTQRLAELKVDDAKPVQISARTAEKIKLKKILDDNSFRLVEVRSDGNCLYHSLVHQLHLNGVVFTVPELRGKTAHYMEKFPDYFKPFLVHHDTGNPFTPEDFAQYLKDIAHTNAWGSQVELRAISADLKWPIRVLQAEGTEILIGEEYLNASKIPLTIVYHRHELSLGEHYNSVAPK